MTDQGALFDAGPIDQEAPAAYLGTEGHRHERATCRYCGAETWWVWSVVAQVWLCNAKGCGLGQGSIERMASPEEVDEGCELGVAWDPVGGRPRRVVLDVGGESMRSIDVEEVE